MLYICSLVTSRVTCMEHNCCFVCGENFDLKYGRPSSSKVPLFKETINKEFTSKSSTSENRRVIISDILKKIIFNWRPRLLNIAKGNAFVCKKCARKVVNCDSLLEELKSLLAISCKKRTIYDAVPGKRSLQPSSPSGFTPDKKKTSRNGNSRESQSLKSRKALFTSARDVNKSIPKKQDIEDAISNVMCLPVDTEGE